MAASCCCYSDCRVFCFAILVVLLSFLRGVAGGQAMVGAGDGFESISSSPVVYLHGKIIGSGARKPRS
jgi:hypothetical protein